MATQIRFTVEGLKQEQAEHIAAQWLAFLTEANWDADDIIYVIAEYPDEEVPNGQTPVS